VGRAKGRIPTVRNWLLNDNEQVSIEPILDISISISTPNPDDEQQKVRPSEHNEEVQEPNLEQVYTIGSLGNTLTWGDQQIPNLWMK
jgi:hypothetical protein